jgi:SnoaL-like domain
MPTAQRSKSFSEAFMLEWIEAWNSHNLERILSHYTDDFIFSSPVLARALPDSQGRLAGKNAARHYWSMAFERVPNLHFKPVKCLIGVQSLVIYYEGVNAKHCAEYFVFNADGLVCESHAHGE